MNLRHAHLRRAEVAERRRPPLNRKPADLMDLHVIVETFEELRRVISARLGCVDAPPQDVTVNGVVLGSGFHLFAKFVDVLLQRDVMNTLILCVDRLDDPDFAWSRYMIQEAWLGRPLLRSLLLTSPCRTAAGWRRSTPPAAAAAGRSARVVRSQDCAARSDRGRGRTAPRRLHAGRRCTSSWLRASRARNDPRPRRSRRGAHAPRRKDCVPASRTRPEVPPGPRWSAPHRHDCRWSMTASPTGRAAGTRSGAEPW